MRAVWTEKFGGLPCWVPKEAKSRAQEEIVNQQAVLSNVDLFFGKADLWAIISK
jgi:hypothetical protein